MHCGRAKKYDNSKENSSEKYESHLITLRKR